MCELGACELATREFGMGMGTDREVGRCELRVCCVS